MALRRRQSQTDVLMEYFKKNPNRNIAHPEIVDWAVSEWRTRTGNVFRDPDRAIRKLYQEGYLIREKKGVYRYEPGSVHQRHLEDFTPSQKAQILRNDGYRCVICGRGKRDGYELHVDHIKPKDRGGRAVITNGQTLCSQHNMMKKNLNQTETGKKMFMRLYELTKEQGEEELYNFCADILRIYEKHGINSHIRWKK
ncbi:MAG: HNH endonuclease [Gemmatimonadetes bacterium]|nr:HNH endonuclease [Gemmatimonadota bacterium]